MYLSTQQAAQLLGVSRQYFHRTAMSRALPYVRIGRSLAWHERDVKAWAGERRQKQEVK